MPVPKRYFKVSQEVNLDPEMWSLTEKFGDRSLRTWLQILIYLDRSENHWRMADGWLASLSRVVRQTPATVSRTVGHLLASGWLETAESAADGSPTAVRARNWLKYNKSKEQKGNGQVPDKGSLHDPLLTFPSHSPSLSVPSPKIKSKSEEGKSDPKQKVNCLELLAQFSITDDMKAWAAKEGVQNPEQFLPEFKDYWTSVGGKRKTGPVQNWDATFRNHIRRLKLDGRIKVAELKPKRFIV
jgi:hypothetical protein